MKYLQDTLYLPLILEDDDSGVLKWYIDGSFEHRTQAVFTLELELELGCLLFPPKLLLVRLH